ncbi:MAG: trehalose-phosphatase, partial [Candidatus Omnitrophica bacterium]|nr:trehalose-phosphatase [Candidatus Omnitrophota bacterium]
MSKYSFDSVIFDLDGVVTNTAHLHAKAWKMAFDQYMRLREKRDGEKFAEFTHAKDYLPYVDGKPRYKGVESFLQSRKIKIPFGDSSDSSEKETVCGLGNKKNQLFNEILEKDGAEVFQSSVELIKELKKAGIRVGVASSSKNCKGILESVGLGDLFETRVDGVVSVEMGLKGKPEGDIFVAAANNIGTEPIRSVVVEDATSGVQAGRNGGFGLVLGVARENNRDELLENGADIVVSDLCETSVSRIEEWFKREPRPLFDSWQDVKNLLFAKKKLVFFLDYDGTLTPIVSRPELAVISEEMQDTVRKLSKLHTVGVVSGRMRDDVENLVGINDIFYAGSHGFDICGPGFSVIQPKAKEAIPQVAKVIDKLEKDLNGIEGLLIEKKKISVAVHYRLVDQKHLPRIEKLVRDTVKQYKSLRLMSGKKVFEILPNISWDKGQAIRWIMDCLKISWDESSVIYIG